MDKIVQQETVRIRKKLSTIPLIPCIHNIHYINGEEFAHTPTHSASHTRTHTHTHSHTHIHISQHNLIVYIYHNIT